MKQDMAMALFNGYIALVRVLHRSGAINISDLTNEIGDTIDIRRAEGWESAEDQEMLVRLYQLIQEMEQRAFQPHLSPAPGESGPTPSPPDAS